MLISKGMLLFSQLSGVFPAKCFISPGGRQRFEFSPFLYKWGLFLVTFQMIASFFALESDINAYFSHRSIVADSSLKAVSILVESFTQNILTIISLIMASKRLSDLISVYSILQRCKHLEGKKCTNQNFKICLIIVFLISLIMCSSRSHIVEYFSYGHLIYLPYLTQYFNMTAMCLQFYYICSNLVSYFDTINEKIQQEVDKQIFYLLSKDFESSSYQVKINKGGHSSTHRIRTLIELYWLLCEAVHQANSFYSFQLLVAVFSSFIHIVITLYYFFLHIWPTINLNEIPYLVMQGLWVAVHVAHLVLLVWPSTAVTEAADETAPMICKIMNRDLNPEIKKQLETFLLQLLHHNARFSALGFFEIHSHILTSMAGSVTTYLVILIQFQTASVPNSSVQPSPAMATAAPPPTPGV